jgi:hypothetical protein
MNAAFSKGFKRRRLASPSRRVTRSSDRIGRSALFPVLLERVEDSGSADEGSIGKASKPLESARTASEKHVFEKYPAESYQKRATEIIRSLRNEVPHYEQYSDRTLLNLSFRCGDELHCQWTAKEEAHMYPFLVHTGAKPVASLVVQNLVDPWVRQQICTVKDAEICAMKYSSYATSIGGTEYVQK